MRPQRVQLFYKLDPEVAGHLGPHTVMDRSTHPPIVHALHYEFDGWLGDELIESFPSFIVTAQMKHLIESARPTGCTFGDVRVSASEQFNELYPGRSLPPFHWLKIHGTAGRDDFGSTSNGQLVVSDRLLQVMRRGRLDHCEVSEA